MPRTMRWSCFSAKPSLFALSALAVLCSLWMASVLSAATLNLDFNDRDDPTLTQSGFDAFVIDAVGGTAAVQTADTMRSFGGIDVTIHSAGAAGYDDRIRTEPVDAGAFTESLLLRDFVFSRNPVGGGIDIQMQGLAPGVYNASIWSFDDSSGGNNRVSDWYAGSVKVVNDYTFNGDAVPPSPASNDTYRIDFTAVADSSGELVISGRQKSTDFGVFLNALQLEPAPDKVLASTPAVSVDFGSGTAQAGFTQMNLAANGSAIDGKRVTVSAVGELRVQRYDVFVNYWDASGSNVWRIEAGLSADDLLYFDENNGIDSGTTVSDRVLWRGFLGSATADELGQLQVFVDDVDAATSGAQRSWLDSIGIRPSNVSGAAITHVEVSDANTVGTVSGAADWHITTVNGSSTTLWVPRSPYGGSFDPIWEASGGDIVALTVTLDGLATEVTSPTTVTLDQRNRSAPTNGGDFDQQDLLRDFFFASNGDVDTSGLNVLVQDLDPNQEYYVTVWAFDDGSASPRTSNWSANGSLVHEDYSFDGSVDPTGDGDYQFSFLTTADSAGEILIEGRVSINGQLVSASPNVFINALQVTAVVPEPGSCLLLVLGGLAWTLAAGRRRSS